MFRGRGISSLVKSALAAGALGLSLSAASVAHAEDVKIGFLVKQPEEPWFQTEWAFAEKSCER